jgi:hypothetical protein
MIFNKHQALASLKPSSLWTWKGFDYSGLSWKDSGTAPTETEIDAEVVRLQADYENKKYQRDRAAEYPTLQDQLDMQYWDKKNGTTTWVDAIAKVKSDNPKP